MHTEVNLIRSKITENPWPKYLSSLKITGLRGWSGQEVRFPFPVSVIAGENGSGKSTVLKVAASAYVHPDDSKETYYPSGFFPDTAWEHVTGVELEYRIKEGNNDHVFKIEKKSKKWHYPAARHRRVVSWQDVARTLPLDGTAGYSFQAKRTAREVSAEQLDKQIIKFYSSIMGREYSEAKFAKTDLDQKRSVGVVKIGANSISQFHQGAGEDATLDFLSYLQNIPRTSLILIDELEASLHPYAQRKMIQYLLWLSRVDQIQIIISSHSPYVLEELPPEARIFLQRRGAGLEIIYGVTPEFALSRMDAVSHPEANLYCEDSESLNLIKEILRFKNFNLDRIKIVEVGPANVVKTIGLLSRDSNLLGIKGCGILDADQQNADGCVKLFGTLAPEKQIFNDIKSSDQSLVLLSQRLGKAKDELKDVLTRSSVDLDHHKWLKEAARILAYDENYLWVTMCKVWIINCVPASELDSMLGAIETAIS